MPPLSVGKPLDFWFQSGQNGIQRDLKILPPLATGEV